MTSSSHLASKKRKRDVENQRDISLRIAPQAPGKFGPVLVSFPSVQPPRDTPFDVYLRKKPSNKEDNVPDAKDTLIAGESETIEFASSSESQVASNGSRYLIGVHDKRTKTTTLIPAPLHILTRQVKSLKNLKPIEPSVEERIKLRNTLGETFGTKKAKLAIRAQERNRVDVDAMKGVTSHLQDRIQENTSNLPSNEQKKSLADEHRLIPPHDAGAGSPHQVYALNDVVPLTELESISIAPWKSASSDKEREGLLPFSRSSWINHHLRLVFSAPKPDKVDLRILVYISSMMAFKQASRNIKDKTALEERLKGVPSAVVDGLVSRFTETARDSNKVQATSAMETRLMTYMFALCLRIDDYATDTSVLAKDLQMPTTRVNTLFRSLGCKIEVLSDKEMKRIGLPDQAREGKRAILRIPFEFPTVRAKRTKRS